MIQYPGAAPAAPMPVPGSANTTYGKNSVTSSVSGGGGGSVLENLLNDLIAKKRKGTQPKQAPNAPGRSVRQSPGARVTGGDGSGGSRTVAPRPPSWQSLQGAATAPVGLGPGMIPGMGVDPRKLPPSMRPDSAQFVGPTHSTPQGSIAPAEPDAPPLAQPAAPGGGGVDPRMAALGQIFQGLFAQGGK